MEQQKLPRRSGLSRVAKLRLLMRMSFKAAGQILFSSRRSAEMDGSSKPPPPPPPSTPEDETPEPSYGTPSLVYMQILFWMSSYVQQRSERTGLSQEQLIEEFGMNLRKTIDPDWRPSG